MPEIGYNEQLFAAACTYLTRGWSVIPVHNDLERAKVAAVRWSDYQHGKPTTMEAYRWFMERYCGGLAIVTGRISGLAVLDFDTPERFDEFEREYPDLTETCRVQTRRGVHLYYHVRQKVESRKAAGVDLQSDGCYVVAPPTLIDGHRYHVSRQAALKTLTEADIQQLYAFLTPAPASVDATNDSEEICPTTLTVGDLVTLYGHLAARLGRNNALFQVSLRARDEGWRQEQVVACLADAHAHQRADGAHHEESLKQRQREAIGTIESAYSRPPRQRRRTAGQMPNSVREALLKQRQTHTLRVIEGLQLRGVRPGQVFTYCEAVQRLHGLIGQWSIRRALTATAPDGTFLFAPSPRPPTQAIADGEVPETQSKQRFMISASKPTKIVRGRPTRCYFTLPGGYELCEKLGVRPSGSDTVAEADVRSARIYRQALHRAYIQRRPGQYPRSWLASRVGISIRTEQRYNLASDIQVKTRYDSVLISWSNLNAICADFEVAGTFLQDERGKRYPARQEIAAHLLAKRHLVIYKRQQANFYAYGDFSPQAVPSSGQRQRIPQARPPARTQVPLQVKLPMPEASAWQMAGRAAAPVSHDAVPQTAPPAMPMGNVQRASPDIPVKPELKSKRFYRRPLADRRMEWLAQQIHLETSAGPAHERMSLCNARRLLDTYGAKPVETALKRMVWLRQKGKISSPAGFLVIASRVAWRVQHGATEFGAGAPRFRGEPGRKAHKRQESQSSEI